jgi:hypothetical protein
VKTAEHTRIQAVALFGFAGGVVVDNASEIEVESTRPHWSAETLMTFVENT